MDTAAGATENLSAFGARPLFLTLTIIVPVYNERQTVLTLLEKVLKQRTTSLAKEIFVVDDCSTDGTREMLQCMDWDGFCQAASQNAALNPGASVRLILHDRNRGKGACVRSALKEARGELVLVQDADLEYDPADYPRLLRPILEGRADAVFGNRFHCYSQLHSNRSPHSKTHRQPFFRFLMNRSFSMLCNLLTGLAVTDVTACYKVLRRDMLDRLKLESSRFSMETELTVKLSGTSARITEVPIMYRGRTSAEGKKITWVDGLAAVYHLLRYRFF